jgi:hypothetical protein
MAAACWSLTSLMSLPGPLGKSFEEYATELPLAVARVPTMDGVRPARNPYGRMFGASLRIMKIWASTCAAPDARRFRS